MTLRGNYLPTHRVLSVGSKLGSSSPTSTPPCLHVSMFEHTRLTGSPPRHVSCCCLLAGKQSLEGTNWGMGTRVKTKKVKKVHKPQPEHLAFKRCQAKYFWLATLRN